MGPIPSAEHDGAQHRPRETQRNSLVDLDRSSRSPTKSSGKHIYPTNSFPAPASPLAARGYGKQQGPIITQSNDDAGYNYAESSLGFPVERTEKHGEPAIKGQPSINLQLNPDVGQSSSSKSRNPAENSTADISTDPRSAHQRIAPPKPWPGFRLRDLLRDLDPDVDASHFIKALPIENQAYEYRFYSF